MKSGQIACLVQNCVKIHPARCSFSQSAVRMQSRRPQRHAGTTADVTSVLGIWWLTKRQRACSRYVYIQGDHPVYLVSCSGLTDDRARRYCACLLHPNGEDDNDGGVQRFSRLQPCSLRSGRSSISRDEKLGTANPRLVVRCFWVISCKKGVVTTHHFLWVKIALGLLVIMDFLFDYDYDSVRSNRR